MKHEKTVEIILVSGACCSPSLAHVERELEKQLWQTVEQFGLDAEVRVVSLSSVLAGKASLANGQENLIQALFQKYGAGFVPAALVDTRVLFAGGAPPPNKLKEVLKAL